MEKYLYEDLAKLEGSHWWHRAKREAVVGLMRDSKARSVSEDRKIYEVDSIASLQNDNVRILDIGCGTGGNLKAFAKFGEAWGIDSAPEAIKYCQQKGLKNVKLGSSDKTGFDKENFDVVTLLDVLEHVGEGPTLREISRVLKEDGKLIITVPAFSWLWSKWDEVLHHKRRYTSRTVLDVLNKNGFRVEKISYMYSFLVLPALLIRFVKSRAVGDHYASDFYLTSPLINKIFLSLSRIERLVSKILPIPFGTSLICVAQKA